MKTACLALIGASVLLATAPAAGAAQYVYPLRGQDLAKQAGDEADCSTQARQQSGFDPKAAGGPFEAYAPTGTASDTVASGMPLTAVGGGHPGGAAGALGGGGPGDVGSEVTNMTGAVGPSLGVVDELTGAPEPEVGSLQPNVRRPQLAPGQAEYNHARATCLSDRGYSVQ